MSDMHYITNSRGQRTAGNMLKEQERTESRRSEQIQELQLRMPHATAKDHHSVL
jgi:hypothetical protein